MGVLNEQAVAGLALPKAIAGFEERQGGFQRGVEQGVPRALHHVAVARCGSGALNGGGVGVGREEDHGDLPFLLELFGRFPSIDADTEFNVHEHQIVGLLTVFFHGFVAGNRDVHRVAKRNEDRPLGQSRYALVFHQQNVFGSCFHKEHLFFRHRQGVGPVSPPEWCRDVLVPERCSYSKAFF